MREGRTAGGTVFRLGPLGRIMSESVQRADRVVVSYDESAIDEELRYWVRDELENESFGAYLGKAHDSAEAGDEWEEFVSRGCGLPVDVRLRVERVDGGSRVDEKTTFEVVPRE
jgi:hypothetical protein